MTYEQIAAMMEEVGLPFAYHHFAEGESPNPPFLLFLSPGEQVESVWRRHHIYYTKTESWIPSEKMYEVLYEMEV